jgi:hypothetical protein
VVGWGDCLDIPGVSCGTVVRRRAGVAAAAGATGSAAVAGGNAERQRLRGEGFGTDGFVRH